MKVILDCDGVIFDSNELKNLAFERTLARRSYSNDIIEEFLAYHKANGGISRYVKFRFLFTGILRTTVNEAAVSEMLQVFGEECRSLYLEAEFTEGALQSLRQLSEKHTLFVASGSDEKELNDVFNAREILPLFKQVLGSPTPKVDCVRSILDRFGGADETVFVGDSVKDYEAASANEIPCFLMPRYSDAPVPLLELASSTGSSVIASLKDLAGLVESEC